MNVSQNINKLLYALKQKGQIYKINSFQFYSESKDKYSTKYQVLKQVPYEVWNEETDEIETKYRFEVKEECYNKIDLMKYFMEEYRKMG